MMSYIRTAWVQITVFMAALVLSYASFLIVMSITETRSAESFRVLTEQSKSTLMSRLDAYDRSLRGMAGLFLASTHVTAEDFDIYAESLHLSSALSGNQRLGFIALVPQEGLGAFIAQEREDGLTEFSVFPETSAAEKYVVKYVWPSSGSIGWQGLDIKSDPVLGAAADKAHNTDSSIFVPIAPQSILTQSNTNGLLLQAVYRHDHTGTVRQDGQEKLFGWVFAGFDFSTAIRDLVASQSHLVDITLMAPVPGSTDNKTYFTGTFAVPPTDISHSRSETVTVFGADLQINWSSTPEFDASQPFRAPWVVLAMGILLSFMLSILVHILMRRERTVTALVAQKSQEIETQQKEYRSIVENALVAIVSVDGFGYILNANQAAVQLLHLDSEDKRRSNGNILRLIPGLMLHNPDGHHKVKAHDRFRREDKILEIEKNNWKTSDGEERITLIIRDISELERHSAEIANTEMRWNLALKGAETGVFDLDLLNGKSIVSDMWREIMHLSEAPENCDPYSQIFEIVHPDDRQLLIEAAVECCDGLRERAIAQFRIQTEDGELRWIRSDAVIVDRAPDGRPLRMLGTQTDITEHVRLESMKDNFIATVSHELRTPLTSIKGAISLLGFDATLNHSDKSKRLLDIAGANCDRLATLVNDILDVERINGGNLKLEPKSESVADLLRTATEINAPYASSAKAKLVMEPLSEDWLVWVDQDRTIQVLSNFLSNACKFCYDGTDVVVRAEKLSASVRISVINQGQGIPESFRSKIFEPFSQADSTDTRKKGGTGLGLNITRKLVQRMGGAIGFDSEPGGETVFWFTCPLAPDQIKPKRSTQDKVA